MSQEELQQRLEENISKVKLMKPRHKYSKNRKNILFYPIKNEYDIGEMAEPDRKKVEEEFLKFGDVRIKKWSFIDLTK